MKDEIENKQQKTGNGACKKVIELYIEKTGIDPMENYNDFIITTVQKSKFWRNRDKYIVDLGQAEWKHLFWKATQSQAAAYRNSLG